MVDDLIATGGTALAAAALIQELGGVVMGCAFVIDLPNLGGMQWLVSRDLKSFALCQFAGN